MSDSNTTPPVNPNSSFLRRIPLAFGTFFSILSEERFAARVLALRVPPVSPAPAPAPAPPVPVQAAPKPAPRPLKEATPDAALQLLGLLQRDARLVDFAEENLEAFSDADIGAAARVVHAGCRKVLREHFSIVPVVQEPEGSRITLDEGFDAAAIRLTGNVVGKAPFSGSLSHRGWRVAETRLPKLSEQHDAAIVAQAEVDL